ncbi:MAG: hypothetical protein JSR67_00700 [Proteobacteria bacterium]|nr:hypothetical protein [Pseudomonadota bacterium]
MRTLAHSAAMELSGISGTLRRGGRPFNAEIRAPLLPVLLAVLALPGPIRAAAIAASAAASAPHAQCRRDSATAPALQRLGTALASGRFVAYTPTTLQVVNGRTTQADPASIRADLAVLRERFDALITYTALNGAQAIPAIAAQLQYRALIIGVWNPLDPAEVAAAIEAARRYPHLVAGISLGNETLLFGRASVAQLEDVIAGLRARLPGLPLSTTEPFHLFLAGGAGAPLLPQLDFLLINVHPLFQSWFRGAPQGTGVQFVVNVGRQIAERFCGPILVKETGEPSGPAGSGFTPQRQAGFYRLLRQQFRSTPQSAFAYFTAFDAPWRAAEASAAAHPEESFWGLYDERRVPKPAALDLPPLTLPPARR